VLDIFFIYSAGWASCAIDFLDSFEVTIEQDVLQSQLRDSAGSISWEFGVTDCFEKVA
jgi:hypothetical protein